MTFDENSPSKSRLADFVVNLDSDLAARLQYLAARMDEGGKEPDSPVREVLHLLGDKWSSLILMTLGTGTFGHALLKRTVSVLAGEMKISQRVLTQKLRALERNGLVEREEVECVPKKVNYQLSPIPLI